MSIELVPCPVCGCKTTNTSLQRELDALKTRISRRDAIVRANDALVRANRHDDYFPFESCTNCGNVFDPQFANRADHLREQIEIAHRQLVLDVLADEGESSS